MQFYWVYMLYWLGHWKQELNNFWVIQAAINELLLGNELILILVQLFHDMLDVIVVQVTWHIRLREVVDGSDYLLHFFLVYHAVVVNVVQPEGDVDLLLHVAGDRQRDREHEITELNLSRVCCVEGLKNGFAILFRVAIRK